VSAVDGKFPGQDAKVLRRVDGLAWGSLWDDIPELDQTIPSLVHAVAALKPETWWEDHWEPERGYSFDLTPEEVDALPDDALRALVVDLVRWLDITWKCTSIASSSAGSTTS